MSNSYTTTNTETFTRTHAIHLASKLKTDLKRMQRFYERPSDSEIEDYFTEAVEFLKEGYLSKVAYGFVLDGRWIEPTLSYSAQELIGAADDDPGRVRPGASVAGASFYSFLVYSQSWLWLTPGQREEFEKRLPFQRTTGVEPGANGYWVPDATYSAGGRALSRDTLRRYQ